LVSVDKRQRDGQVTTRGFRVFWLAALTGVFLPFSVQAGGKVTVIRSSALPLYDSVVKGFKRCSKAQAIEDVTLTGEKDKDMAILAQVSAKAPDVVLSLGTGATRLVRDNLSSIPSVFAVVIDPTSNKIAPPGVPLDLQASTQLEFIHRYFPHLKRIGVLYSPGRNVEIVSELRTLKARGETISLVEVASIDRLDAALQTLASESDCLLMLSDPTLYSAQTASQLILQTLQRGLPIIAASPAYVKAGAMAGIYAHPEETGCSAAAAVDRVAAGEKVSSSFMWPTKYSSAVNMIVAGRLKVTVPPALMNSAEQVVK
jgi:putative tryptophan/tyrosine transport system substrate-binding protein